MRYTPVNFGAETVTEGFPEADWKEVGFDIDEVIKTESRDLLLQIRTHSCVGGAGRALSSELGTYKTARTRF